MRDPALVEPLPHDDLLSEDRRREARVEPEEAVAASPLASFGRFEEEEGAWAAGEAREDRNRGFGVRQHLHADGRDHAVRGGGFGWDLSGEFFEDHGKSFGLEL